MATTSGRTLTNDNTSPIVMLADASAAGSEFNGVLDEVAYYEGVALTAAQVQNHYQKGGPAVDAFPDPAAAPAAAPAPTDRFDVFVPAA